ncbi:MAG: MauE/DoxX family redox-associated membrane protein, partial [Candidatus Acidiferrales bacterium]
MSANTRNKWGNVLLLVARLTLGTMFLVAGYNKLKPQVAMPWSATSVKISLSMFAMTVDAHQILPPWAVNTLAHVLPFFELFLGLWVVSGIGLRFSSVLSVLAFCVFMTAMAWAWH